MKFGGGESIDIRRQFMYITSVCPDAIVENGDDSFHQTNPSGSTLVLNDNTYNVYVNTVLRTSGSFPSQINNSINIS